MQTHTTPGEGPVAVAELDRIIASFPSHDPPFEYSIGWAEDFDAVLQGRYLRTTSIRGLLDTSLQTGRVILQAEGGSGKTTILQQLFKLAVGDGILPVLISLRDWQAPHLEAWRTYAGSDLRLMGVLLGELGRPQLSELALTPTYGTDRSVILLDGLNEVPADLGGEIIRTLDSFAQRVPSAGVIISDRLARRPLRPGRWDFATVAEVGGPAVHQLRASVGERSNRLLRTAYFLDRALRDGVEAATSSQSWRAYFSSLAQLSEKQVQKAAQAAFEAYERYESRLFDPDVFARAAGSDVLRALIEAGAIISADDGLAYFSHHLQHDYLAAVHVSRRQRLWNSDAFDVISLHASSFDAPAMILEQLESEAAADRFLRRIYDWNFYAAAYVLAKGGQRGAVHVSEAMRTAILALLAEKRWDPIEATAERVTDALRIFRSEEANAFLRASSLAEVFKLVQAAQGETAEWFDHWRRLFVTPAGSALREIDISALEDEDSLMGWTLANVLKRVQLQPEQQAILRGVLLSDDKTTRWRAAHALGAHPSPENAAALLGALDDGYRWVRYGAIRSVVELAARASKPIRMEVFKGLEEALPRVDDPGVRQEFVRAVFVRHAPDDWVTQVGRVVEAMWGAAKTVEEQERWTRLAVDLKGRYGSGDATDVA
jgi:HEAT repeats